MSGWFAAGEFALFPSRYLGSIGYYAALSAFRHVAVDEAMKFDKRQKPVHRCRIADTHGEIMLTVPVEKPVSMTNARWCDILVSGHGNWQHVHWVTLQSAYGRTPFFEYYADDFAAIYNSEVLGHPIVAFNRQLDSLLRRLFSIPAEVHYDAPHLADIKADFRRHEPEFDAQVEYYQVRGAKHGFIPSLSAVDLLFNMGPESPLVLVEMAKRLVL